jgi:hypothetical protein
MKWSQAICASILVDEFYFLSPHTRSNPRSGRDVPGVPLEPALRPNLFTADWGLPPKPVRTRSPKPQAMPHKAPDCHRGFMFESAFTTLKHSVPRARLDSHRTAAWC